jgi:hypothetical protein
MAWDTVLVDGTDILTATRFETDHEGYYAFPNQRGELLTYPGIDGETNVDQPFGPTVFPMHLVLLGADQIAANDEMRTLRRLCKPGRTVTLTKRMAYSTGNESLTATGKLKTMLSSEAGDGTAFLVAVEFSILSGVWYGTPVTTSTLTTGSNSVTGSGDTRTQRMTITLTGGTDPHLLNAVGGHSVAFSGSMGSPVVIDVEAGTAMQGATDVSQYLTWSKVAFFRINAGVQTITLTGGGTASISYSPAYL